MQKALVFVQEIIGWDEALLNKAILDNTEQGFIDLVNLELADREDSLKEHELSFRLFYIVKKLEFKDTGLDEEYTHYKLQTL